MGHGLAFAVAYVRIKELQAIEAVCGLFHGQETCRTEFTVTRSIRCFSALFSALSAVPLHSPPLNGLPLRARG